MRKMFIPALLAVVLFYGCWGIMGQTIHGNGNMKTETRDVSQAEKIKSYGSFDIVIVQGETTSVKVDADENLLPYIVTDVEDGALVIKPREHYNLSSDNKIKITVTTKRLQLVDLAGSGNVVGEGKFTGSDNLKISVAGSGDVSLDVNTPDIDSHIAGTGNITLSGETKSSRIEIAGVGNYNAADLMSENVEIHIAGSGSAKVYAENNLDIHIAGSGDVYYKGNASVKQDIAGSGKINKVD